MQTFNSPADWQNAYSFSFLPFSAPSAFSHPPSTSSSVAPPSRLPAIAKRVRPEQDEGGALPSGYSVAEEPQQAASKRAKVLEPSKPSRLPPSVLARSAKDVRAVENETERPADGKEAVLDLTLSDEENSNSGIAEREVVEERRTFAAPSQVVKDAPVHLPSPPSDAVSHASPSKRLFPTTRVPLPPQAAVVPPWQPYTDTDSPLAPITDRSTAIKPAWSYNPAEPVERRRLPSSASVVQDEYLSEDLLFPSLARLTLNRYAPFLLNTPIDPSFSASYYEAFVRFLGVSTNPVVWCSQWQRLLHRHFTHELVKQIQGLQPDKEAIRAVFPTGLGKSKKKFPPHLEGKWDAMAVVMRWLWEYERIGREEVAWLVEFAPLPVHILVRDLSGTLRLGQLIYASESELLAYLSSLSKPSLSPLQAAHLTILEWLNERNGKKRKHRFFCHPRGTFRGGEGEEPWDWFFERLRKGLPMTKKELDEWEDETIAREGERRR